MSPQKDTDNPRKPPRKKSSPDNKAHKPDRAPRGRAVTRRQGVGSAGRDEHEHGSAGVDTLQKVITTPIPQDQPQAGRPNQSKEPGVFSAALAHKEMEEAEQRAIREGRGSGASVATKKRQKAQVDARKDRPGEASMVTPDGRKKHRQSRRPPTKLRAEENTAIPERISEASLEVSRDEFAQRLRKYKQSLTALADKAMRYALQHWGRTREAVGTYRKSPACQHHEQPPAPVAPPQYESSGLQTTTVQNKNLHQFIQVRYQNDREGQVDDITLDGLIESKRISHFYRPSEDKWVDIVVDPVRERERTNTTVHRRRASDGEGKDETEEKPHGLFSGRFRRHTHRAPPKKELTAQEYFQLGLVAFHTTDDCEAAVRSFALSIHLNPIFERAYVNRALAYEKLSNVQQAIEDFSSALVLNPSDEKVYYLRGLSFRRLGMDAEAIADLKKAADLRFRPAYNFLKSMGVHS